MLFIKVIFYLTLIIGVIAFYSFCLYKAVTVPISNEVSKLHVDGLISERIALEVELEKVTVKLEEKIAERDEVQAAIVNLTETANNQGIAFITIGVFIVGCVAFMAFTYFKSSSDSDMPSSSGSVVDVAQCGITNLLNSHIEATKMIADLEAKSQQINISIFELAESVSSLKAQIAVLSVSIKAGQNKVQFLINLIEMSQK